MLGPAHVDVMNVDALLASALVGQGRHDEAIALFVRLSSEQGSAGPGDAWRIVRMQLDFADCCLRAGRDAKAAEIAAAAFEMSRAGLGPDDARTLEAARLAATTLDNQGEAEAARRYHEFVAGRSALGPAATGTR